jgi:hypothetical protein
MVVHSASEGVGGLPVAGFGTPCLRSVLPSSFPCVYAHEVIIGDRNAHWFFISAVIASVGAAAQNYGLMRAGSDLTAKLRAIIFQATLRQDSK